MILTDRTRQESYEHCPRLRFLRYHWGGTGLTKTGIVLPLATGRYVHKGITNSVEYGDEVSVDDVVERVLGEYRSEAAKGIWVEPGDDPDQAVQEQLDLVEGLVRGWCAVVLPELLKAYEIIAVEQEETFTDGPDPITMMVRPDFVLRRRADGTVFTLNPKTVSNCDRKWREQWPYDTLTASEVLAVEARLGERLGGVIIQGLVKGRREEYPKGSGRFTHNSPLIYCWHKRGEAPFNDEGFYARYAWSCTAPHTMANGRKCPGGQDHRLSGAYKAPVREVVPGGIKGWIEHLATNERPLLEAQFVTLEPILRSDYDLARWRSMILAREVRLERHARLILGAQQRESIIEHGEQPGDVRVVGERPCLPVVVQQQMLDEYFPMHTSRGNCLRPSKCEMFDICHGASSIAEDPLENGYERRVPNHLLEREPPVFRAKP